MPYPAIKNGITCASHALWQQKCPMEVCQLADADENSLKGCDVYVSPQKHHWPVYDPVTMAYVDASDYQQREGDEADARESLRELSREEAWSLSIVRVFMDLKQDLRLCVYGGLFIKSSNTSIISSGWHELLTLNENQKLDPTSNIVRP